MHAETAHLAATVRRLRTQADWTLDHAASRLGISRRLLSQIEAGDANPSLTTLLSIAAGFGVELTALLDTPAPASAHTSGGVRADAPVLWSTENGSEARLLVGRGPLELWHWTLQPGDGRVTDGHHPSSREIVHTLAGTLEVEVDTEVATVRRGHSLAFDAGTGHAYRNRTAKPVTFLLTVFDPVV